MVSRAGERRGVARTPGTARADDAAIRAISNFIEYSFPACRPSTHPGAGIRTSTRDRSHARSFIRADETRARDERGEEEFPRTRLCLRNAVLLDCDRPRPRRCRRRRRRRHRRFNTVATSSFYVVNKSERREHNKNRTRTGGGGERGRGAGGGGEGSEGVEATGIFEVREERNLLALF